MITLTLNHDLLSALRVVLYSPYTVSDSLYPSDSERADFLAQQLKEIWSLLPPVPGSESNDAL